MHWGHAFIKRILISYRQSIPQFTNHLRHSLLIPTTSLTATMVATNDDPPLQCITLQLFIPSVVPSLRVMTQLILCLAFDYKHISSSDAALLLKLVHKKTHRVYLSLLELALGEASSCAVHLPWDQHAWGRPHGEREMPALRPVVPVTPAHVTEEVFSWLSPCHHQTRVPTWEVPSWAQSAQSHKRQW